MSQPLPPAWPRRFAAATVVFASLALTAAHAVPGAFDGLAYLLPALLLGLALAARLYPGERALVALCAVGARHHVRRRAAAAQRATGAPRAIFPRGGLLLGASLAVRPPPRRLGALS